MTTDICAAQFAGDMEQSVQSVIRQSLGAGRCNKCQMELTSETPSIPAARILEQGIISLLRMSLNGKLGFFYIFYFRFLISG